MRNIFVLVLLSSIWTDGIAQSNVAEKFVGTWKLQVIESKTETGEWRTNELLGPNPLGVLTYDEIGNMTAQLARIDRTLPDPENAPVDIVNGYISYFGKYEIDEIAGTVTHHRTAHINPDVGDISVVRHFQFEGDVLTLTVAPDRELRLIWVRQQ
jgi:hypothetical protein